MFAQDLRQSPNQGRQVARPITAIPPAGLVAEDVQPALHQSSEVRQIDLQFAGLTASKPYLVYGQGRNALEETGIENIVERGNAHPGRWYRRHGGAGLHLCDEFKPGDFALFRGRPAGSAPPAHGGSSSRWPVPAQSARRPVRTPHFRCWRRCCHRPPSRWSGKDRCSPLVLRAVAQGGEDQAPRSRHRSVAFPPERPPTGHRAATSEPCSTRERRPAAIGRAASPRLNRRPRPAGATEFESRPSH